MTTRLMLATCCGPTLREWEDQTADNPRFTPTCSERPEPPDPALPPFSINVYALPSVIVTNRTSPPVTSASPTGREERHRQRRRWHPPWLTGGSNRTARRRTHWTSATGFAEKRGRRVDSVESNVCTCSSTLHNPRPCSHAGPRMRNHHMLTTWLTDGPPR